MAVVDEYLSSQLRCKPLNRQALVSKLTVEGLVAAVLPRLALLDQQRFNITQSRSNISADEIIVDRLAQTAASL